MKEQQVAYGISRVFNVDIPNLKHDFCALRRGKYRYHVRARYRFRSLFAFSVSASSFLITERAFSPGVQNQRLKWKPPSDNSVDFRVRVVREALGKGRQQAAPKSRKRSRGDVADGQHDDPGEVEKKKTKTDLSALDREWAAGHKESRRPNDYDRLVKTEFEEFDFGFDSMASETEADEPKPPGDNNDEAPVSSSGADAAHQESSVDAEESKSAASPRPQEPLEAGSADSPGPQELQKPGSADSPGSQELPKPGNAASPRPQELQKLELYVQGKGKSEIFWAEMAVTDEEWQRMNADGKLDGRIAECTYSEERGGWVFMRFREDKLDPNYFTIVEKIMESIRDGVESEELVKAEPEIRGMWKKRDSTRPEQLPAKRR
ncbi:MAG: hypothetical protein BJ554DRAFT_5626 [Olpidium bornovanus]|uniref:mRNA capping enzyme C-terminal domain-containing protein n=1 Tax=Olpidium bornovanus TaxID=278681 RepID=A0A8H8A2C6_9FUNG|nr:MAG: hypothetical protein BJ554DRAFT_5626 [Olpidium bornovanus]